MLELINRAPRATVALPVCVCVYVCTCVCVCVFVPFNTEPNKMPTAAVGTGDLKVTGVCERNRERETVCVFKSLGYKK